jgi:hypothetical protein
MQVIAALLANREAPLARHLATKPTPNDKYTIPQDLRLGHFMGLVVGQLACQWYCAMQVIAALLPSRGIAAGASIGHKETHKMAQSEIPQKRKDR